MSAMTDCNVILKLTELIESIATSGSEKQTAEKKMKEVKKICRISDAYVLEAFKVLMHQLNQKHCEIRLAAFNILKELFQRSNYFRELVAADFQIISKLVLDIDPKAPLPPPPAAAKQLKLSALKTITEWNETYGEAYKKLRIGYNYLKKCRIVDFNDAEARNAQERQRIAEKEARIASIKQAKLESLLEELNTEEEEILNCIVQIQNGLALLIPDEFPTSIMADKTAELKNIPEESNNDMRAHGMMNASFSLVIEVQPIAIKVNRDNKEIIQCLQEQYQIFTGRFAPMIIKWNISASKLGAEEQLQKRILDIKLKMETTVHKYHQCNLPTFKVVVDNADSSDMDSDLETVPDHEGYREDLMMPPSSEPGTNDEAGPSQSSYIRRQQLKRRTPTKNQATLPLDIDSYEASQSELAVPTFSTNPVESYWVRDPENTPGGTGALVTNPVELSEAFQPVKWTCRAPLPRGSLCPRRDRHKCPLHGQIIARDEQGQPVDPSSVRPPVKKDAVPDWQEPSLLADIKAATGVDLTMPVKGKRAKKNPHPNLTDLKLLKNTPRTRLEQKVLKRSTVKKVASTLDSIDAKHSQSKFGEQWNYN